ncbi:hypothetical protein LCGC14_2301430 [marine sediment metagenome]|uniref:Uncharacterized protein n=1 Tax=marine sediment metagenome TaxID=412755 RepID=A0A0F9F0T2_9ZZZZ
MHAYLLLRGARKYVRRFKEDMEMRTLSYKKDGQDYLIQLIPRTMEIVELVFPEEHLQNVLNLVGDDEPSGINSDGSNKGGVKWYKKLRNFILKMIPNVEPVPIFEKDNSKQIPREHIGVHVLGIKNDSFTITKTENL